MAWVVNQQVQVGLYFALQEFRAACVRRYVVTTNTNGGVGSGTAASFFYAGFSPLLSPLLSQQAEFRGVLIWSPPFSGVEADRYDAGPGQTGSGGNDSLPPQVCGKIRLQGTKSQTRRDGWAFIPFPSADDNDASGRPNAAYLTNLQTLASAFTSTVTTDDFLPVPPFTHRITTFRPHLLPHSIPSPNFIVQSSTMPNWGTQRRRATAPLPGTWPFT